MGDGNSFWDSIVEKWLPGSLQEIVGFLANLVTISGILYSVICIIFAMFQKQRVEEIPWKDILFPVFILLFVSTLLRYSIKASNYRKIQAIVSRNYYWFLHDYRNAINKLENEYKTNTLTEELLHGEVKNYLEISLNYLSDTFISCFLQALFPQKCRLTSSKLHREFPQYCISPSGTLLGAGEEPLQAYKVY